MKTLLPIALAVVATSTCGATDTDWVRLGPGGGGSQFIPTYAYNSPDRFLVRCDMTGSYLTTDGGQSFSELNFDGGANAFAFAPSDPGTILVGTLTLNRSTDGGKTWERILPHADEVDSEGYFGDHADFFLHMKPGSTFISEGWSDVFTHICVDPLASGKIFASVGSHVYCTLDGGETWSRIDLAADVAWLYTDSGDFADTVLAVTPQTISRISKATGAVETTDLPMEGRGGTSYSGGSDAQTGKLRLFTLRSNHLWRSSDAGQTWELVSDPVFDDTGRSQPVYSMVVASEHDSQHVWAMASTYTETVGGQSRTRYGALHSSDGGDTWQWVLKAGAGLDPANLNDGWIGATFNSEYIDFFDVGVSPTDGRYAAVTDWYRTLQTKDGGTSWVDAYSETMPDGTARSRGMDVTTCYGVHVDPFDPDHIAISYTDIGYHHSFNGGASWKRSVSGISATNTCYWVVFDPDVKDRVWSVWSSAHDYPRLKMTRSANWRSRVSGGPALSTDGGRHWTRETSGIGTDAATTSIVLDPTSDSSSRTLYVTAYNKGVYKSTDGGATWVQKNAGVDLPAHFWRIERTDNGDLFLLITPGPSYPNGQVSREYFNGAVYRSTDGAESWTKLSVDPLFCYPTSLANDPSRPSRLYVSGWSSIEMGDITGGSYANSTGGSTRIDYRGGVWISDDGGDTWRNTLDPSTYVYAVTPDPRHPGRVFAVTFHHDAYQSDDYGETWHKLAGYDFEWGHRAVPDPRDPDKVFITTFGSSVWYGTPVLEHPRDTVGYTFPDAWHYAGTDWYWDRRVGYIWAGYYPWIYLPRVND